MDVLSACPLRVASIVWQPRPGAFALTVVAVATYRLAPIESQLAPHQEAPVEGDRYWDDDERRSLHTAGDLAPFKPRADVVLVGHACAPGDEPVASLVTRLVVGAVDKSIEVYGDRAFSSSGALTEPARFVRMPLRWERAAGGPHTVNPVGVPVGRPEAACAPNLQPLGARITRRGDVVAPIGYGPIAPTWPSRLVRLGHHAFSWDRHRWNQQPLPHGVDPSYFNVAPPDQQLDTLVGNEQIVLESLLPGHARLVTRLVPATPHAVIERPGEAPQPLWMRCDTLSIDTDRGVCTLAWRGVLSLRHPFEAGRVVIVTHEAAQGSRGRPELPNEGARDGATASAAWEGGGAMRPSGLDESSLLHTQAPLLSAVSPASVLPFRAAPASAPPTSSPPAQPVGEGPDPGAHGGPSSALPFVSSTPAASSPAPPVPASVPAPMSSAPMSSAPMSPAPMSPAPPSYRPTPAPVSSASPSYRPTPAPISSAPPSHRPTPPPMLGPLATPDMVLRSQESAAAPAPAPAHAAEPTPAQAAEPAPAQAAALPFDGSELPLHTYPLERCAAIAASLACRPSERAAILEQHGLTPEGWADLDEHWAEEIRAETARGRGKLLWAYDAAYVAQLEAERGPIGVTEYAQIVVAAERGEEEATLAALRLPRAASLRIQRVWLRKIASDATVAERARKAVAAAREA